MLKESHIYTSNFFGLVSNLSHDSLLILLSIQRMIDWIGKG